MKRVRRVLLFLVILYSAWLVTLFTLQGRMVFPRMIVNGRTGPVDAPDTETWWINTDEGRVPAWFIPARDADEPVATIVFLHGNAMLIEDWWPEARQWAARGWNVLLPEFRGYGHAAGSPTQERIVGDVTNFVTQLATDERVDAGAIAYIGQSIGGAIAAQVARRRPPAALVLRTTPASVASMAWRYGAPSWIVTNPFRTAQALEELRDVPMLLIDHADDEIIRPTHAERLAAAAPQAERLTIPGTHNVVSGPDEARVLAQTEAFLGTLQRRR